MFTVANLATVSREKYLLHRRKMNENQIIQPTNLQQLQVVLERVVGKLGMEKTVHLLESFDNNSSIDMGEKEKLKVITTFIISQCISIFNLEESEFYTSEIREYREARMISYHLIHTYTKCSYAKIGEVFGRKKRNVLYFCQKCRELLSVPGFYREFVEKHKQLDKYTIEFIGKLN